jgi:DNA-binding transcriptional LysR family regulator
MRGWPGIAPDVRAATGRGQGQAAQASLAHLSVGTEPLLLALPDALPIAHARRLSVKALLAEPLIVFPREVAPSLHDAIFGFYHRHGAVPAVAQEAIQMQTLINLVSAGLGVAWVPASMTQLQRPGVVYRRLPAALAAEAPHAETSLVWPASAGPVVDRFVDFVRRSLPKR